MSQPHQSHPSPESVPLKESLLNSAVIVSALGYFVDIYDLILFSIVRIPSLETLGYSGDALMSEGAFLQNMQMSGMLVGGILWGILGDRVGRVSVLFGSILLYSLANFLNAFVTNIEMYAVLRVAAGIGLAGELGAAITLVSETMTTKTRGAGACVVAGVGVLGAVAGGLVADFFSWQTAYMVGGGLGFLLLITRYKMFESGMFNRVRTSGIQRGQFLSLFTVPSRFKRYIKCVLFGGPLWYVVGILVTFSPEFAKSFGIEEPVKAGRAVLWTYLGLSLGDFASGFLSQILKSRLKAGACFLSGTLFFVLWFLIMPPSTANQLYWLCSLMGFAAGYWALFVLIASEQFGTNIRATVTTTVPNFVRGSTVPLTLGFQAMKEPLGLAGSAGVLALITFSLAFWALWGMDETYGKNLDFLE